MGRRKEGEGDEVWWEGMGGSMIGEGGDVREYDRRGRGWEGV